MRHVEVQYITRDIIARLKGTESLLRMALTETERERRAARLLVSGFMFLVSCFAVLLWVMG